MAVYEEKDFADIIDRVREELKVESTDTRNTNRIKRLINEVYTQEVVPFKNWPWLQGRIDIEHKPVTSDGTVSVTPDSTTITFSTGPLTSKTNYFFSVDGFSEIYKISAHTAGATTATLASVYTGSLNATASYKVWTEDLALPTDCRETVEVWHDFSPAHMEGLGQQEFRRRVSEGGKATGRPVFYTTSDFYDPTPGTDETEADRYRLLKVYPAIHTNSTTIHVEYVKEVDPLELDGDEPIMPTSDRVVLVYGALAAAWATIGRNPEEAARNQALYDRKLARMAGKVEDSIDKPQMTIDSRYITMKRGPRFRQPFRRAGSDGGGSYTSPTFITGASITNSTITGTITVNSGVTIDGRDISADGALLDGHIADTADAHAASAITNTPSGNLAATTVQAALDELQTDVDTRATSTALADHIDDTAGAHAASAISNSPSGNLAATTVQAALNELQTDVDTRATAASVTDVADDLADHLADTADAHDAEAISVAASGNLSSTNVQDALEELQGDIDAAVTAPLDSYLTATSVDFLFSTAGFASGEWAQFTDNKVSLTAGSWMLFGQVMMSYNTAAPTVTSLNARWSTGNGNNTSSSPTAITPDAGSTDNYLTFNSSGNISIFTANLMPVRHTVGSTTDVYLNANVTFSAAGTNAFLRTYIYAQKIED
jgi:hypothetical protein